MGFGLLLCGYFALTMMSVGMGDYSFAAHLLGGMLCASAALKLKAYNPRFILTAIVSVAYVLMGVYQGVAYVDHHLLLWGFMPMGGVATLVEQGIMLLLHVAFHGVVLWAVAELTAHLELADLKSRAVRNLFLMAVYAVGEVVVMASPAVANLENQAIPRLLLLYLLVCYVLNAWLLFSCYQLICPAGEEEGKPRKPSRFAFVNKLNDKFDEKAERAMRENMAYQAEKQAARQKKKKKKK